MDEKGKYVSFVFVYITGQPFIIMFSFANEITKLTEVPVMHVQGRGNTVLTL